MLISIITCSLNNRSTIESSIGSILSQTYRNIELIVVDGGSVDGTKELIKLYDGKIARFISEKDNGLYYALNKGIVMATGQIVGILHADDFYANNNVLQNVINIFKAQEVDSIYGDLEYVDSANINKVIRHWRAGEFSPKNLINGWMPPHPTLFLRKEIYDKYGLFDCNLKIAADYDLILRFFYDKKISTVYFPNVIVKMRFGGKSNRDFFSLIRKTYEDYIIIRRHKIKMALLVLLKKNLSKFKQFLWRT